MVRRHVYSKNSSPLPNQSMVSLIGHSRFVPCDEGHCGNRSGVCFRIKMGFYTQWGTRQQKIRRNIMESRMLQNQEYQYFMSSITATLSSLPWNYSKLLNAKTSFLQSTCHLLFRPYFFFSSTISFSTSCSSLFMRTSFCSYCCCNSCQFSSLLSRNLFELLQFCRLRMATLSSGGAWRTLRGRHSSSWRSG